MYVCMYVCMYVYMYVCMYVFVTLPFTGLRAPFPLQFLHFHLNTIPYANLNFNASFSYFLNYELSRDLPGLPFPLTNTFQAFQFTQHYFCLFFLDSVLAFSSPFHSFSLLSSRLFIHFSPCPQPSKIHFTLSTTLFSSSSSPINLSSTCSQDSLSYPHTPFQLP